MTQPLSILARRIYKLNHMAQSAVSASNHLGLNITNFILPATLTSYQATLTYHKDNTTYYHRIDLPTTTTDEQASDLIQQAIQGILSHSSKSSKSSKGGQSSPKERP